MRFLILLAVSIFGWGMLGQESAGSDHTSTDYLVASINQDLYIIDLSDNGQTQLTNDAGAGSLDLSPDGERVVFASTFASEDILVFEFETGETTNLTNNEPGSFVRNINPRWSPDGSRIAFASDRTKNWEIYVMNADSTDLYQLTHNEASDGYNGLTWSPDSTSIAFVRDSEAIFDEETGFYEDQQIMLLDVTKGIEGSGEDSLINLTSKTDDCPAGEVYYNPTWSTAANWLAYSQTCGGDYMDIFIMDMSDLEDAEHLLRTNLTHGEFQYQAGYRGISWSSDGAELAFVAIIDDESLNSEIMISDVTASLADYDLQYVQLTRSLEDTTINGISW